MITIICSHFITMMYLMYKKDFSIRLLVQEASPAWYVGLKCVLSDIKENWRVCPVIELV